MTDSADLHDLMAAFDDTRDLAEAATPPAAWYLDPRLLELERRALFHGRYQVVGHTGELREPGDYISGLLLGEPWLVVVDGERRLRAFHNVCRHHAAGLLEGCGRVDEIVCPYHGWTYRLDGSLRRAPHVGGIEGFDVADFGLVPLALHVWEPFIAVALTPPTRTFAEETTELGVRLEATGHRCLRHVERREYTVACNWKVYVDNYLDGGYHVACLHPGLGAQLDLGRYRTEIFERYSIQSCDAADSAAEPSAAETDGDFAERIGDAALYAWIYPNLMINRYGPIMDTNRVLPIDVATTQVIFDYFFDERCDDAFIERSLAASHQVQREDEIVCASVQRGLGSRAYDTGRYAPRLEAGEYHFHRLLAADLRRAAGGGASESGEGQ